MVNARRLCRGAPRNPHPHRIDIHARISLLLLIYSHVHAIRDDTEQLARRALHRKRIPAPLGLQPRGRGSRGDLEQGERVATVRAQRTVRRDVHVVPFCAPSLAAYHACECAAAALSSVVICICVCAPTIKGLSECDRARGG